MTVFVKGFILAVACSICLPVRTQALYVDGKNGPSPPVEPARLIVKLKADAGPVLSRQGDGSITTSISAFDQLNSRYKIRDQSLLFPKAPGDTSRHILANTFVLSAEPGTDLTAMKEDYEKLGCVIYAEPDCPVEMYGAPDDPLYSHQWGIRNVGQGYYHVLRRYGNNNDVLTIEQGTPGADISADVVFQSPPDNTTTVIVAIIDTGVDLDHPDLAGRIWTNPGEIADDGVDNDRNGYIDDIHGWDFAGNIFLGAPDNDPTDTHGHGTHCAGIVTAVTNNATGVTGIVSDCRIMALKFYPLMLVSWAAKAIVYAADNGADVVNMSWGLPYRVKVWEDVLAYARAKGVILCAAAGNDGAEQINSPAGSEQVMAVSASDSDDRVTQWSSYGDNICVCAPGQSILSLCADSTDMYASHGEPNVHVIGSEYYLASGTSMSSPHLVGIAAYLRAVSPGITHDKVREVIEQTADDILDPYGLGENHPGWDKYSGYGRINLHRALLCVPQIRAIITSPVRGKFLSGVIQIKGSADGVEFTGYTLEFGGGRNPSSWTEITNSSIPVTNGILGTWDTGELAGTYTIRLRLGEDAVSSVSVYIANMEFAEISSPAPGDTLLGYVEVVGTAICPDFVRLTVELGAGTSPSEWDVIHESGVPAFNSHILTWLTDRVPRGMYTFRLSAFSKSGRETSSLVTVFSRSPFAEPYGWRVSLGGEAAIAPNYGDFDNDGAYEIVIGTSSGIRFFNADGTPKTTGVPSFPEYDFRLPIAVGELDGDGVDDFVAISADPANQYSYYSSTASIRVKYVEPPVLSTFKLNLNTTRWPVVSLIDINGDGLDEVRYLAGDVKRSYLYADIDGDSECEYYKTEYPSRQLTSSTEKRFDFSDGTGRQFECIHLSAVDVDGDRRLELIALVRHGDHPSNYSNYLLYAFDGNLKPLEGFPHDTGINGYFLPFGPVFGDLDNDGDLEYVITWYDIFCSHVCVWHADGTPFAGGGWQSGLFTTSPASILSFPGIADVDGDKIPEIVVSLTPALLEAGGTQSIEAWRNNAELVPGWPMVTDVNVEGYGFKGVHMPVIGDIDQDGLVDAIMTTHNGDLVFTEFSDAVHDPTVAFCPSYRYNRRMNYIGPVWERHAVDAASQDPPIIPCQFSVDQNYPNPFNLQTVIEFTAHRATEVELRVFNILGQTVTSKDLGILPAGRHSVTWNARADDGDELPSGVYFYRISVGHMVETKKMLLLK